MKIKKIWYAFICFIGLYHSVFFTSEPALSSAQITQINQSEFFKIWKDTPFLQNMFTDMFQEDLSEYYVLKIHTKDLFKPVFDFINDYLQQGILNHHYGQLNILFTIYEKFHKQLVRLKDLRNVLNAKVNKVLQNEENREKETEEFKKLTPNEKRQKSDNNKKLKEDIKKALEIDDASFYFEDKDIKSDLKKLEKNSVIISGYINYLEDKTKPLSLKKLDNNFLRHELLDISIASIASKDLQKLSDWDKNYLRKAHEVYRNIESDPEIIKLLQPRNFSCPEEKCFNKGTEDFKNVCSKSFEVKHWKFLHVFVGTVPLKKDSIIGGVHFKDALDLYHQSLSQPIVVNKDKGAFIFYKKETSSDVVFKFTTLFLKDSMQECIQDAIYTLENIDQVLPFGKAGDSVIFRGNKKNGVITEVVYDIKNKSITSFYPVYDGITTMFGSISADNYQKFLDCYNKLDQSVQNDYQKVYNCLNDNGAKIEVPLQQQAQYKTPARETKRDQDDDDQQEDYSAQRTPNVNSSPVFKQQGSQQREVSQSYRSEDARLINSLSNHSLGDSFAIQSPNNQQITMSPSPIPVGTQLQYSEPRERLLSSLGLSGQPTKEEIDKAYTRKLEDYPKDDGSDNSIKILNDLYNQAFPQS